MHLYYDLIQPILIAVGWFTSVYFATVAIVPAEIAAAIASVAMLLALLWLNWLRRTGMDRKDAPIFFLLTFPIVIFLCGVGAWIARWWVGW